MVKIKILKEKRKSGQMKINQMSFLLIAVFLFLALAGMFFLFLRMSVLKNSASDLEEENAILLVAKFSNTPEFSCGNSFGSNRGNCIDLDKVMVLKNNINKYQNFWGIKNIEIRRIYPKNSNIQCTSENYPNCDTIILLDGSVEQNTGTFVALCRKEKIGQEIQNKCEIGKIYIGY